MAKDSRKAARHTSHPFAAESRLLHTLKTTDKSELGAATQDQIPVTLVALDEVGRGCLAGPLVVCATAWQSSIRPTQQEQWLSEVRDSKKISSKKREDLFAEMLLKVGSSESLLPMEVPSLKKESRKDSEQSHPKKLMHPRLLHKFSHSEVTQLTNDLQHIDHQYFQLKSASIGFASAQEIDAFGISDSLSLAAQRALSQLPSLTNLKIVFFDGNRPLKLNSLWSSTPQCLVTQGDDCLKTISASSVLAKVVRDRWMDKYSSLFPSFGFSSNKGYGTASHRQILEQAGPSQIHRLSFLKNICPAMLP